MQTQLTKLTEIKSNPNNPRLIKDEKFKKLVQSIKEFPQMLELRPIVVNDDMIVLGGNMRLKACKEAGLKEVPVIKASDLSEEQQRAFIIKDNVGYGEWDWDLLANEWDAEDLVEWGLDVWQPNEVSIDGLFNEEGNNQDSINEPLNKIVLEYTQEDYDLVVDAFKSHSGTKEQIVFKLLGL